MKPKNVKLLVAKINDFPYKDEREVFDEGITIGIKWGIGEKQFSSWIPVPKELIGELIKLLTDA